MLRIELVNEPPQFNLEVRRKGLKWMANRGLDLNKELPEGTKLPDYWKACSAQLRMAFEGRCCYSGSYMRQSEIIPVEHAIAKSLRPDLAYEWANYRYASQRINGRKGVKIILDPAQFPIGVDIYFLDFVTGSIFPNSVLKKGMPALYAMADQTISALGLDDELYRDERMEVWGDYMASSRGKEEKLLLRKTNNFIWHEATRQGLL
jgi:hypothetical protein